MQITLRQVPYFLRRSGLYKNFIQGEHDLDEWITVQFMVKDEEINNIEDFKNVLLAEEYWGTYIHPSSIYFYALEHRNEVIEFLSELTENNIAKELLDEVNSGLFIVNNKNQLLGHIKEKYPSNLDMHKELEDTMIYTFKITDLQYDYWPNINIVINGHKTFHLEGSLYVTEAISLVDHSTFKPLLIKDIISNKNDDELIIAEALQHDSDSIFEKKGNVLTFLVKSENVFTIVLTKFNKDFMIESLQELHERLLYDSFIEIENHENSDDFDDYDEEIPKIRRKLNDPNYFLIRPVNEEAPPIPTGFPPPPGMYDHPVQMNPVPMNPFNPPHGMYGHPVQMNPFNPPPGMYGHPVPMNLVPMMNPFNPPPGMVEVEVPEIPEGFQTGILPGGFQQVYGGLQRYPILIQHLPGGQKKAFQYQEPLPQEQVGEPLRRFQYQGRENI